MTTKDELYARVFPQIQSHFNHSFVLSDLEDAAWDVVNALEDVLTVKAARVLITAEELKALPDGTLISTPSTNPDYPTVFRKEWEDGWMELDPSDRDDGEVTQPAEAILRWTSKDGTATVLWEPAV
ncbi:hypothetical protein [Arthrobacter sp. A2-55]|uniref:hypothetical protein n=1 Tax=Arthrobacter sp. A2-55 TaxID=2897337 RepID=UPI0021CDD1EB|nr:hypothetical protein [Arthrobacter sp. A2-55]MCU6481928.1 hypothetical protein [Arthrobacter sp. A2-55]